MDFQRIGLLERFLEAVFWNFLRAPYNMDFVRSLGLKGDERILEFGSGSGAISRHLARILCCGGRLSCVDTSQGLMAIARKRLGSWSNVEFHEADLRRLRLPAASFDAVVVHFVLHDVPAPDRAPLVREMTRLLTDNGRLIIREPTRPDHGMPPREIRDLARSAGLGEVCFHHGRRWTGRLFSMPFIEGWTELRASPRIIGFGTRSRRPPCPASFEAVSPWKRNSPTSWNPW